MDIPGRTRLDEPGSLETMPSPVNWMTAFTVDSALPRLGRALWPARCLVCGERGHAGRDLCQACAHALPWNHDACNHCAIPMPPGALPPGALPAGGACGQCLQRPPPLQMAHAACRYEFPVNRLLPRLKFHRDLASGRLLAQLMADAFATRERPQALLAVPLHRDRLRHRGYDQALELARPLARLLRIPLLEGALRRTRATAPQSELDAAARQRNLRRAFACNAAALPAHVALVDDVMTTGATLHAAAATLPRAGVRRVDAWVCARVP